MGCHHDSRKSSYYKLLKKHLKESFDNIITSQFNKSYSIQLEKFEEDAKKKNYAYQGDNTNWKSYLLDKLFVKKTTSWKYHLYNYILNDKDIKNSNFYCLENEIFIEQFFLPNSFNSKDDNDDKDKDKIENKKFLSVDDSQTIMNGEFTIDFDNLDDERALFNYNAYKIRENINLMRKQLEKMQHPINKIIKKFSELYTYKIKKEIENENIQDNTSKIESLKKEIIKDIQDFIEIISVSLKLFYSKTINYEFFLNERDEFLNMICNILFKEKAFYNNVFELFNLSNMKKTENFQNEKEELKELTPKDACISVQFRLNDETNQLKNSNYDISDNSKSKVFIEFLTRIDLSEERYNSKAPSLKTTNDNILKVKKESKRSVKSYKDFKESYNNSSISLQDKMEINLSENLPNSDIISLNEFQNKLNNTINKPYGEAIEYIQTIKDYNAPLDKLKIIALTSVLITKCIDKFWKGKKLHKKNI